MTDDRPPTDQPPSPSGPAASPAGPSASDGPPIGAVSAIVGTFTQPGRTFEALVRRPQWLLPLLLWVAVVFASVFVATPKIDMERSMREILEKRAARTGQEISDQQIREIAARQKSTGLRSGLVASAGFVVSFLVVGLLFWGGARAFGSEARYPQVLAVWGHANLVNVVGGLLSLPVLASLPDASETQLSLGKAFKSNLGAFLPDTVPAAVGSLATSVDVFTIAALVLLVIGMRRLPALPRGAATAIPLVFWGLYVLAKAGLAAVFLG